MVPFQSYWQNQGKAIFDLAAILLQGPQFPPDGPKEYGSRGGSRVEDHDPTGTSNAADVFLYVVFVG